MEKLKPFERCTYLNREIYRGGFLCLHACRYNNYRGIDKEHPDIECNFKDRNGDPDNWKKHTIFCEGCGGELFVEDYASGYCFWCNEWYYYWDSTYDEESGEEYFEGFYWEKRKNENVDPEQAWLVEELKKRSTTI
jgi:hypothetical protein